MIASKYLTKKTLILIIGVIVTIIVFFLAVGFKNLAKLLYVNNNKPDKIDVIFVYAWDIRRMDYAKTLLKRYKDSIVLISDPYAKCDRLIFKRGFVDNSRMAVFKGAENTFHETHIFKRFLIGDKNVESLFTHRGDRAFLPEDNKLSVALVSSPLHMRRIKFCSDRSRLSRQANVYYMSAPLSEFDYDEMFFNKWWETKFVPVIKEFVKLFVYVFTKW